MSRHLYKSSQILLLVLCCLYSAAPTYAWLARGRFYNEANPGKCSYETLVLSPGESAKSPIDCARITCDSADGLVTIAGCIAIMPPPNCIWTDYIDINAPYPECCARHYRCEAPVIANGTQSQDAATSAAAAYAENVHNQLHTSVLTIDEDEMALHKQNDLLQ